MPGSPSYADVGDQPYNEVELPSSIEIRESSVSDGQPGAFCKTLIRKNTRFGPYKGEIIKPSQKADIDYRYAWEIFEKKRNVLKFTISASDPKASNWMRNVNCARFYEEQNILSTQEGYSIFYVAMKDIKPGEELLTWFDPQLLKRTQRRVSRGERKKVGYTIELVPWTDEKKFVPEIIETKRARKKKVLGEDMLSFEEDAALMQRSMNSMFRIPRKVEPSIQPKKDYLPSSSTFSEWSPKKSMIKTSTSGLNVEKKSDANSLNTIPSPNSQKTTPEKQLPTLSFPTENHNEKKVVSILPDMNGIKSPLKIEKKEVETVRKRKRRGRVKGNVDICVKKYMDRFVADTRNVLDSTFGYNPNTVNLLKPVVIRTKENGSVEMEDHDETYIISWSSVRQECDDMCQCMDKQGLSKPETDTSSSLHKGSQDLIVQFTLLPEHQTVSENNKVTYKCDICECSYNHAFSLKRHYLGVHINHRYISKYDVEFCQLETFHSGFEEECPKEAENCGNALNSEENLNVSTTSPGLITTTNNTLCPSENSNTSHGSPCSLLCNEVALDSSADEGKADVPKLSSLARAQCEKNKCSSALTIQNQNLSASDKLDKTSQKLTEKPSKNVYFQTPQISRENSSVIGEEIKTSCDTITHEKESSEKSGPESNAPEQMDGVNSCRVTSTEKVSIASGEFTTDIRNAKAANVIELKEKPREVSSKITDCTKDHNEAIMSPCEERLEDVVTNDIETSKNLDYDETKDQEKTEDNIKDACDEIKNARTYLTAVDEEPRVDEIRDQVRNSDACIAQSKGKGLENEKLLKEEIRKEKSDDETSTHKVDDNKTCEEDTDKVSGACIEQSESNCEENEKLLKEDSQKKLSDDDKSTHKVNDNKTDEESRDQVKDSDACISQSESKCEENEKLLKEGSRKKMSDDEKCTHKVNDNITGEENRDQVKDSDASIAQNERKCEENEKLLEEESQKVKFDNEESTYNVNDNNTVEGNKCSQDERLSEKNEEASRVNNANKTSGEVLPQLACETSIHKVTEEKSNTEKHSKPQIILPKQTSSIIQTTNFKNPQTQQQFLLLVPIGTASSKIPSLTQTTATNSFNLPQSKGNLPVVVLSSQVPTTCATSLHLQSSTLSPQLCPQIVASPCQSLTTVSPSPSNLGQRFALIPHNPQNLVSNQIHTTSANIKSQTSDTKLAFTTSLSTNLDRKVKLPPSVPSNSTSETDVWSQAVKLQEADQPSDLYRCHMCVLVYKTMSELKHHIKNDPHRFKGGIKQYACPKCSVRFRNKANLARHTLMHHQISDDKDRKFRCTTCGKGFTTETYLKMHARFHTGKSFPCKYGCVDAFFPNAGSLVKHLRAVHPGLNLKEYLREKKRREKMTLKSDLSKVVNVSTSVPTPTNVTKEYSMTNPGIGFQAKRGRPKGSKNVPKEMKVLKLSKSNTSISSEKALMPVTVNASGTENFTPTEMYPPVKKYYPIEKTWQKGSSFFKISTDENNQTSQLFPQRRFTCKLCDASFKSHLFLLKHRSRRHGAGQSVQEYLFEMAKDREEESCPVPENAFEFSPPPSPKTFFSNVNQRGAENISKYIEGSGEMLKCRKKISFDENTMCPFSSPPQLEWTHYNFPPCFKYVRDNTSFYHNVALDKSKPKVEKCEVPGLDENTDPVNEDVAVQSEKMIKSEEDTSEREMRNKDESGMCKVEVHDNADNFKEVETSPTSDCKIDAKDCDEELAMSNKESHHTTSKESDIEQTESQSSKANQAMSIKVKAKDVTLVNFMKDKDVNDSNTLTSFSNKPDIVQGDMTKGLKKSQRKVRAGMDEMMIRLNRLSIKALDLEIGSRHIQRHSSYNTVSIIDTLNLFSKDGNEMSSQKYPRRKKRERFASISACSQLLPSKTFCRSRDQLTCSIFSSPDIKDTRRYSMWQGPNCHKVDTEPSDKFCCPVVESVRQQEVSKKRKEIQIRNDGEVIDIKPKEKMKEDFASSMGLMSWREYERSYHAQEKTEHCIKPPEIWERYDRIWFGKKGTITVVCSICHRHFSCQELCLRHQLKKHPHIEPSSLEMERDNYVEDMYYYYPMPYGILAQTHLIPEKMPPPELYVCTRCRFPFKNINKLYSHIVACDPNSSEQAVKNQSSLVERNVPVVPSQIVRTVTTNNTCSVSSQPCLTKPQRQRSLNGKYKSYQLFYNSTKSVPQSQLSISSGNKELSSSPVPPVCTKSQNFMNFSSSFQRRKRNQHGLLYNPSNHTRRRELVHVLDQHQCHGCNLKFKSMSMLERHVKKCSGKDKLQNQKPLLSGVTDELMLRKQHTCRYCNKRFTFIKGVDLHYKRICSVRKIREEENQLTEEDLAHEAELQRIIEHLKWSKSLNQDSSDIIQGRVKVEEDGSLTRVDKKRGRPFGKGKRIKKKGFKWTTLKYHRPDDENSVTNGEPISSVEGKFSNESHASTMTDELSKKSMNQSSQDYIKEEEKPAIEQNAFPVLDIPKRKRGRPFKNGGVRPSQHSDQPKRKRGRPSKRDKDAEAQRSTAQTEMSLKDSINFKRGELKRENIIYVKKEKPAKSSLGSDSKVNKQVDSRMGHNGCAYQKVSKSKTVAPLTANKPMKSGKYTASDVSRKRKVDEETSAKPPVRARGRPKKFDPSDMESSYKKKRKNDLGYTPFVKRTNRESNDSQTETENYNSALHSDKTTDKSSLTSEKSTDRIIQGTEQLKDHSKSAEKDMNETNLKIMKEESLTTNNKKENHKSSQPKTRIYNKVDVKSSDSMASKITTEKRSEDGLVHTISEVKKVSCDGSKLDVKKRKETSSIEDLDVKKAKCDTADSQQSEKKIDPNEITENAKTVLSQQSGIVTSPRDGQTESKSVSASQERLVTVTMASTSPNGDMVQTPVAVRIVTLPISSLAPTIPSNVLSPPTSSLSVQPLSPSPAVSSPLMKLTIAPNPEIQLANKTLLPPGEVRTTVYTSVTTTTSTATIKSPHIQTQNIPKDSNKMGLQPPAFPVRQIIPISNQNVLIPPETIHSGLAPRFIIHSSPRMAVPNQKQKVQVPAATTLTRHVSPSTVILSTGKVVSLGSPVIPGSSLVGNPGVQQAANVMKKLNVMTNMSTPTHQFIPSPPQSVMRKGMGIVVEPPKLAVPGGSPPSSAKPLYYVQTSPLSNQVVMPISTIKGGVGATATNNQVLLNLKDGKTNLNTLAVPQLQFIPVSLVQGMGQSLNPPQIVSQPTVTPVIDNNRIANIQENENS